MMALVCMEVPDFPTHLKILHVKQEVKGSDTSVLQTVLDSDIELKLLREQRDRLEKVLAPTAWILTLAVPTHLLVAGSQRGGG
jgi:hypothetical protein